MLHLLVACLNEQSHVCVHKPNFHRNVLTIRHDSTGVCSALLDEGEDVIPSKRRSSISAYPHTATLHVPSAIQTSRVLPQFEQNFFHVECCRQSFDQNRSANSTMSHANVGLAEVEDIIPQTSLEIMFYLGKVEIRPRTTLDKLIRIVEEVKCKVKDTSRHRSVINCNSRLVQVPSSGTVVK